MTTVRKSDSTDIIALILEVVFGLFGALGLGWLYAGNIGVSVAVFVGYLVWLGLEVFVISITLGLAACLFVPLNVVIVLVSGVKARDYVRNTGASGNLVYVVVGAVGGLVVACVLIIGLVTVLGGIGALMGA